ncbi:LysR family transcriptional regulator [Streptomyces sparsogenes]|uniref:LysR family transcriptional regulator n=1 Tax=Streptomyces sparsogenes TaxID=67365 RepID=UPI0033E416D6
MTEMRQLQYFIAVAERQSFTRAAEDLLVAQPALSQQVRGLERELGVRLLERSTRHVNLTDAGEAFLLAARRAVDEFQSALDEARSFAGLVTGKVKVGGWQSMNVGLPALLASFRTSYPAVDVEIAEIVSDEMLSAVRTGNLDAALIVKRPGATMAGLIEQQFITEPYDLAVSDAHALAQRGHTTLAALSDELFVLHRRGSAVRQTILTACDVAGFKPRVVLETGEMSAMRAYVAAGLGVTILPRSSLLSPGPQVCIVRLDSPELIRTSALIWSSQRHLPPGAQAFIEFTRNNLGLLQ